MLAANIPDKSQTGTAIGGDKIKPDLSNREKLLRLFKKWSCNEDGTVSRLELERLMRLIFEGKLSEEQFTKMMMAVDDNRNGVIQVDKFVNWFYNPVKFSLASDCSSGPRIRRTMGRSSSLKYMPGDTELVFRPPTEKTAAERELIRESLRANPNLPRMCPLSDEQIEMLVDVAWKDVVEKSTALMVEGDLDGTTFWIVASGEFEIDASEPFEVVTKGGFSYLSRPELKTNSQAWNTSGKYASRGSNLELAKERTKIVRKVRAKSSFGDSSLLYGAPRWCTCTALEDCVVWAINQNNFKIVQQMQGSYSSSMQKSAADELMISQVLHTNANLQRLTPLRDAHINPLVKLAWCQDLAKDQILMVEGDLNADALYIVASGSLQFSGSEPFQVVQCGDVSYFSRAAHQGDALDRVDTALTVKTLGRGHCFGEISMLYCAPRFATVKALENTKLWAIDRSSFTLIQMKAAEEEVKDRVKHLEKLGINILNTFSADDKEKFAGIMEKLRLVNGEKLQNQGEVGEAVYILCEGSVKSTSNDGQTHYYEAKPAERLVYFFGEKSIVSDAPCKETVVVTSSTATCLVLRREEFRDICDNLLEAATGPAFERYTTTMTKVRTNQDGDQNSLDKLTTIGPLGSSVFGPIDLVKNTKTGELFARKQLNKGRLVQKGCRKSLVRERTLWSEVTSPFIVRLVDTYNEPETLSYLLEPALGGELGWVYERNKLYGSNKHSRYYVAGVVLALEHLHKRQIIYRNLKPQNILLSKLGHPKLTDMCLAKRVVGYTYTTCGTPTYMAPEIIRGSGHSRAVDWWTLGVLMFELMSGQCPFESDHPMDVYSNVMRGITRVEFPERCAGPVAVLVKALLHPVEIDRLPMRQGGIRNIMDHEWFSGFDWVAMSHLGLDPPFTPAQSGCTKDEKYLANFAPRTARTMKPIPYTAMPLAEDEEFEAPWDATFGEQAEA